MRLTCVNGLGDEVFEKPASLVLIRADSGELLAVAGEVLGQTWLGHCGEPDFPRLLEVLGLDRTEIQLPQKIAVQMQSGTPKIIRLKPE